MNTKIVTASYAIIGAAMVASFLYTKKLERETIRFAKKMEQDMENLKFTIAPLIK